MNVLSTKQMPKINKNLNHTKPFDLTQFRLSAPLKKQEAEEISKQNTKISNCLHKLKVNKSQLGKEITKHMNDNIRYGSQLLKWIQSRRMSKKIIINKENQRIDKILKGVKSDYRLIRLKKY